MKHNRLFLDLQGFKHPRRSLLKYGSLMLLGVMASGTIAACSSNEDSTGNNPAANSANTSSANAKEVELALVSYTVTQSAYENEVLLAKKLE